MGKIETFFASLAGKLITAAVVIALAMLAWNQWQASRSARTEARLGAEAGAAASASAEDAIATTGGVSARSTSADDQTRRNTDAIRNAAGADAPVDPDVRDAGFSSLCQRAAYRGTPDCMQRFTPGRVAQPGAGRTAAGRGDDR